MSWKEGSCKVPIKVGSTKCAAGAAAAGAAPGELMPGTFNPEGRPTCPGASEVAGATPEATPGVAEIVVGAPAEGGGIPVAALTMGEGAAATGAAGAVAA